jgi:hypothetical protein
LGASPVAQRGGQIGGSDYVARAGSWREFWAVWQPHLAALVAQGKQLVFISDGVVWLHEQLKASYPQAVLILDIYHVMQHLAQAAQTVISRPQVRKVWLKSMYNLLVSNKLDEILGHLKGLSLAPDLWKNIRTYLLSNRHRMQYETYLKQGLCIGSAGPPYAAPLSRPTKRLCSRGLSGRVNAGVRQAHSGYSTYAPAE